ncbi:transmembrane protein, putative [Medicago truncatula]|uniref:Transmembrane protein, putative n=1 Tax=Medicago truncatula TaxID=3880 RepID=A0A072V8B0_MEDTR|nr:transmembrane protein, putative [Medicago truncatula]
MTLASSTLQIRRQEDSEDLNIVIFVGIGTLPFYAINTDDTRLRLTSSSPLSLKTTSKTGKALSSY